MEKCTLHVAGALATDRCGNFNLCAGMRTRIEGVSHSIRETGPSLAVSPLPPVHSYGPAFNVSGLSNSFTSSQLNGVKSDIQSQIAEQPKLMNARN